MIRTSRQRSPDYQISPHHTSGHHPSRFRSAGAIAAAVSIAAVAILTVVALPGPLAGLTAALAIAAAVLSFALVLGANRELERAAAAQTRFLADASHQLRTPVTALRTLLEVSLRDPELGDPPSRDVLQRALVQVRGANELVDRLLDQARVASPHQARAEVALDEIVAAAIATVELSAQAKGTRIRFSPSDAAVIGDAFGLTQALTAVLDNAVKYGPPADVITVTVVKVRGRVLVAVSDGGEGIPVAVRARVFEPFARLEWAALTHAPVPGFPPAGTGLGLAIALEAVRGHGGSIRIDDSDVGGARVTIDLPAI